MLLIHVVTEIRNHHFPLLHPNPPDMDQIPNHFSMVLRSVLSSVSLPAAFNHWVCHLSIFGYKFLLCVLHWSFPYPDFFLSLHLQCLAECPVSGTCPQTLSIKWMPAKWAKALMNKLCGSFLRPAHFLRQQQSVSEWFICLCPAVYTRLLARQQEPSWVSDFAASWLNSLQGYSSSHSCSPFTILSGSPLTLCEFPSPNHIIIILWIHCLRETVTFPT